MSVHNFSHLQQPHNYNPHQNSRNFQNHVNSNHNNHLANGVQPNGTTSSQVQYQIDNDYISRGFVATPNHADMSVQLTRPTSKTALLVRQRRELEQLSCHICKGYLIDATTIDECMDSFCKSCIVIYLRSHNNCPKCGTLIHRTNPFNAIHSDKVLQDIVYKLVPGLYDNEMKRRREFYRTMYGGTSTPSSSSDDDSSFGSLTIGRSSSISSEQYGVVSHPKSFYKPTDSIDLSIEPHIRGDSSTIYYDNKRQSIVTCFTGNIQQRPSGGSMFSPVDSQQFKTYLKCPASLTTLQLKKFIAAKFNISKDDTIHLLYLNESLKDEYSLIDIAYIYDWRGIEHMRLFYIIERDLLKAGNLKNFQSDCQSSRKLKERHSVGTSTHTPKRVCIDPHPKYYYEPNNNEGNGNTFIHSSGRTMRPRVDTPSSTTKAPKQSNQLAAPILRSSSARSETASQADEALNKELLALGNQVQVSGSPFENDVNTPIGELSRLKQDNSKETRSMRKQITATESIPRINIQLTTTHLATDSIDRAVTTHGKANHDACNSQRESISAKKHTSSRQALTREGYSNVIPLPITNPPQSSKVTLEGFTQARSNNLIAGSNSATTISNSYRAIQATGSPPKPEAKTVQISKWNQPSPQLAVKSITERGVTIVRQMYNHGEWVPSTSSSNNTTSIKPSNSLHASPRPPTASSQTATGVSHKSNSNSETISSGNSSSYHTSSSHASSSVGTGMNTGSNHDGTSGRRNLKVKPVYKTFVDPTKLKSPNFKRLGYTARH